MQNTKKEEKDLVSESKENTEKNEEISELISSVESQKIMDLEDQLLRAVAETQNIQKRAEKERSDIAKYCVSEFAKDVLPIRDNLQLALNNCKCAEEENLIIEGIKLTMNELDKTLSQYGITKIDSLNKEFDPNFHQAVVEVEDSGQKPGIVVKVMQEGFMIHDRLLRPALVSVSKKC
jgi:molecular chaperone GrpE